MWCEGIASGNPIVSGDHHNVPSIIKTVHIFNITRILTNCDISWHNNDARIGFVFYDSKDSINHLFLTNLNLH